MAFDYKKAYREFYQPGKKPSIVTIPKINFIAVRGKGDPNQEDGEYKTSISLLYGIAYTIKMSRKGDHRIDGYFDFVVPPLEGFWRQEGAEEMDLTGKERLEFASVIRLPDFVTKEEFDWAVEEATRKKKEDYSRVEFLTIDEGVCVQCMHVGPYDDEPRTVAAMREFAAKHGFAIDVSEQRRHHEIYLSDPRRTAPERLKTVIRLPVREV